MRIYIRGKGSKTYKWKLHHIDDDEDEALYFRTKEDAVWHALTATGFMLDKEEYQMSKLGHLVEEIEATLEQEKEKLLTYGLPSSTINLNPEEYANMQGWIEALEYVLKQIEVLY